MRIGLICPYNYFRPGGVQSIIRELAIDLEKRGHYVRVIAPKPRVMPEQVPANTILIGGSAELNTPFATKSDVGISVSNEKLDAMLEEHNFDVLHFHEPGVPVIGVQLLSRSKAANVATMHATFPEDMLSKSYQKLMKPVARYMNTHMHALTAVSSVAEATAHIYVPTADITVIPNGIRLADYVPTKKVKRTTPKKILYVGRLEKRKGVKHLLKAYALLRQSHDDVELIIAGNGDLRTSLETYITKFNVPDVSFKGWVTEDEKVELLQTADVYCSPALYGESFGIVLLEAMAAGAVTVAGNNPGYASVMMGRGRLSLVGPEQTVDFSQRLELMLYDQELRKLWLDWAQNYVKQFDYQHVVDQYEAIYKQAIKKHKATL